MITIPIDVPAGESVADAIERVVALSIAEIERRQKASGTGYPFELVDMHSLRRVRDWDEHIPYIFCLILSSLGHEITWGGDLNAWLYFERVASIAAKDYMNGEVYIMGTSRADAASLSFADAVEELCKCTGEGACFFPQPTLARKDDGVDLVAWKGFRDAQPGQLIMFGQCAGGYNWESKLNRLAPSPWCAQWMSRQPPSPLIRSFYVPHTVVAERWDYSVRNGGILFDRCRIAATINIDAQDMHLWDECQFWCELKVPEIDWGERRLTSR